MRRRAGWLVARITCAAHGDERAMSAKGRRSRAWDDRVIPAWAAPLKWLLRAFSSVWLAVALLSLVVMYSALASVPIGLAALAPTYAIYGFTLLLTVAIFVAPSVALALRLTRRSPGWRFAGTLLVSIALAVFGVFLWNVMLWPHLRYDAATGGGFRLFANFVEQYKATTLRRLPAFEMTEPEFYAWWPLRIVLWTFILNLMTATVRRIEFRFENIGVLTVHTGIIMLALGSAQYASLKQEGDVLLIASQAGAPQPGPETSTFYDRDEPALWLTSGKSWEQRSLKGLPRYNDYGLTSESRQLSMEPKKPQRNEIDPDIHVRVVGYASYATLTSNWTPAPVPTDPAKGRSALHIELLSRLGDSGQPSPDKAPTSVASALLVANAGASRVVDFAGAMVIERVPASQADRWDALGQALPAGTQNGLVVKVASTGEQIAAPIASGQTLRVGGYSIQVQSILPAPPFPIITPEYEDAQTPVVVVRVTPPEGDPFDRYVYTRYPEISQDIMGTQPDGRPIRRDADPAIRIWHIDATRLSVFLRDGVGTIVRKPGGAIARTESLDVGGAMRVVPMIDLRVVERIANVVQTTGPRPVPLEDRKRDAIGTNARALLGVEVSLPTGWNTRVWLSFSKYIEAGVAEPTQVALPGGRTLSLLFSRVIRRLPGVALQLVDFEMIPYPHSDTPRDFMSRIRVVDHLRGSTYERVTRLNRPLRHAPPNRLEMSDAAVAAGFGWLFAKIAPNTYKFSQAGWDAQGWTQTKAQADAGLTDRPRAAFTILGVGNNPGIRIIAMGAVLFSIGVPWAFYVKPWLVRRRSAKLRAQYAGKKANREQPATAAGLAPEREFVAVKSRDLETIGATP